MDQDFTTFLKSSNSRDSFYVWRGWSSIHISAFMSEPVDANINASHSGITQIAEIRFRYLAEPDISFKCNVYFALMCHSLELYRPGEQYG